MQSISCNHCRLIGRLLIVAAIGLSGCQSASKRVAKQSLLEPSKVTIASQEHTNDKSVDNKSSGKSNPKHEVKSVKQQATLANYQKEESSEPSLLFAANDRVPQSGSVLEIPNLAEKLTGGTSSSDLDKAELPTLMESQPESSDSDIAYELEQVETVPQGVIEEGNDEEAPNLSAVVESVRRHFPVIQEAEANRTIASGEALSAMGAFDRKLEGYNNGQPQDFYENNWHKWSLKRNTMWGGSVGAGYRIGRGSFEPWYKERETNDGGEFSVSFMAPIGRDREIDQYRAELWRAQLERGRVEPFIRAQVIMAVREGAVAYWKWVAANENLRIANEVLKLGTDRVELLTKQIELGEKARIDLVDNRRIIVTRMAKQTDARRKLQQAAIKLSLYLRTPTGQPLPLAEKTLVDRYMKIRFPEIVFPESEFMQSDLAFAQSNRPELTELNVLRQQVAIARRQAFNETRPDIDAGLLLAQDVGNPTKDEDKSEFEVEATLTVSVPLERRKARGKIRQLNGKLAQLRAKTQFTSEKIKTEVDTARAALVAADERVSQTTEGLELAKQIQVAEFRLYEEGQSTLFNLNLREKQTAEAAGERVNALLDFYLAEADYRAALGLDTLNY